MIGTLDDVYLTWLYGKIASVRNRNPERSHWELARQLYSREFTWFVPNDDNRAEDGKKLRLEFIEEQGFDEVDPGWLDLECSMLEMLIALSRRASFQADEKTPVEWFWMLIDNAGLAQYNDKRYDDHIRHNVELIIDRILERRYSRDGLGGLFPILESPFDQRKAELWVQMSRYILEEFPP